MKNTAKKYNSIHLPSYKILYFASSLGGMQDFNYLGYGIFETTLEVSCCKFPETDMLEYFWIENKDALVNYLLEVNKRM